MQAYELNQSHRANRLGQKPCVIWLTGISGAGKSTIANELDKQLHARSKHAYVLDGDNIRTGLNKDLQYTDDDRAENIRRVAEVAHLMVDAGLIVITAFISPFEKDRQLARGLFSPGAFIEVYIDTPLCVAEQRDPKGLYKRARSGQIANFTALDSAYEPPIRPELTIDTTKLSAAEAAATILAFPRLA